MGGNGENTLTKNGVFFGVKLGIFFRIILSVIFALMDTILSLDIINYQKQRRVVFMAKFICSVCGYIHEGNEPPEVCPVCGAPKSMFKPVVEKAAEEKPVAKITPVTEGEYTPLEMSALFSNLANTAEKQYRPDERDLFLKLAAFYKEAAVSRENPSMKDLDSRLTEDVNKNFAAAKSVASDAHDRGALRALVWSEKVSLMQSALVSQYLEKGDALLAGKKIFVCPICGFISIGEEAPVKCPVCSVPAWKFEEVA